VEEVVARLLPGLDPVALPPHTWVHAVAARALLSASWARARGVLLLPHWASPIRLQASLTQHAVVTLYHVATLWMIQGSPALIHTPEATEVAHQLRLKLSTLVQMYLLREAKVAEYMLVQHTGHSRSTKIQLLPRGVGGMGQTRSTATTCQGRPAYNLCRPASPGRRPCLLAWQISRCLTFSRTSGPILGQYHRSDNLANTFWTPA